MYTPSGGGEKQLFTVQEFEDGGGVALGMYNTDKVRDMIHGNDVIINHSQRDTIVCTHKYRNYMHTCVYTSTCIYCIAGYFGGLLEKGRKLADINLAVTYDRHAFSGSLRGWRNIGGFNIGGVTRNPSIRQI